MNPFEILGVAPGSDEATIRRAWKVKARLAHPDVGGSVEAMQRLNEALDLALEGSASPRASSSDSQQRNIAGRIARDAPSFTVSVLPVEAFEALLVVAQWMGDIVLDEPPYALELYIRSANPYWVRLDIVPEAGSSTVSITLGSVENGLIPSVESVRDSFVTALNSLDWAGD